MSSLRKRVERDDLRDEQREKRKEAFDADVARIREQMQEKASKETVIGTASVELIRENPDGSADYVFNFPPEAMAALTRLGIMTAIKAGLDEAKKLDPNVDTSDMSQERVDEKGKQRHEWVGLTTEEVKTIVDSATCDNDGYDIFTDGTQVAFLVEAKLKEKNT